MRTYRQSFDSLLRLLPTKQSIALRSLGLVPLDGFVHLLTVDGNVGLGLKTEPHFTTTDLNDRDFDLIFTLANNYYFAFETAKD